jgi:hypothetical protein
MLRVVAARRALHARLLLPILALAAPPAPAGAAVLALRPGAIDRPLHFVTADFNRDGRQDLLIAAFQAGALTLLLGNGDGTFEPHPDSPFPVGLAGAGSPTAGPLFIAAADFNPEDVDGDNVGNGVDNCPNVYNAASLGVQPDANMNGVGDACEVGILDPGGMIIGTIDTDGDGVPDYDPIGPVLDNCPLMPNPGQEDTDPADQVGDACAVSPDLIVVESTFGGSAGQGILRLRVNTGAGGMAARTSKIVGRGPSQAVLGDFDADGRLDLVVSVSGGDVLTFFGGLPNGEFGAERSLTAGDGPQGMAAGDFNLDGRLDLAVGNRSAGTLDLFLNDGTSLPAAATSSLAARPQPTVLLAGLVDADTCPDLVILHQADGGECSGGATPGAACATNADCPDDDPMDTVVPVCSAVSPSQGYVTVLTTAGGGPPCDPAAAAGFSLPAGRRPTAAVLSDLDGSGTLDLALSDFTGGGAGSVLVYAGAGDGSFALAQTVAAPALGARNPTAVAALDYDGDGDPDLGVLGFANNRLDLLRNDGGLAYSVAPESPVSRFKGTSFVAVTAADNVSGADLVLVQSAPAVLAPLSGIGNGFFRLLPEIPLAGPQTATDTVFGDIREDNRLDLLVVDAVSSSLTLVRGETGGTLVEEDAIPVSGGPTSAAIGNLWTDPADFDRDGVPNVDDNCPARYNPPGCTVMDPECFVDILCTDTTHANFAPTDCGQVDPVTGQCDSDGNGVGDHCQVLSALCNPIDTDLDGVRDYDPATLVLDNCPFFPDSTQADASDPDDGVGDVCDRGVCGSGMTCVGGPAGQRACVTDADCGPGVTDVIAVSPGSGAADGFLTLLTGDGSGAFRPAPASPLGGLVEPSAAVAGPFSHDCVIFGIESLTCRPRAQNDLLVAERHTPGNAGDDTLTVFQGDGTGTFTPLVGAATQGDPSALLVALDQPVCANPATLPGGYPAVRFRNDHKSAVVAVAQPGTDSIGIFLPGGRGECVGGTNAGGPCVGPQFQGECPGGTCTPFPVLVPPPARPEPLPVPGGPPVDLILTDLNRDSIQDIVAVTREDGDPATPSVVVYMAIGNGLFYTDPTLNPAGLDGDYTVVTASKVTATPGSHPDVILFDERDGAPVVLTNILRERADIDGSGRVDGLDLAILARAFGGDRGEDFTILGPAAGALDGTLLQSGTGFNRVVVGSGVETVGQDVRRSGLCDGAFLPVSPTYGLAVDIDLDGVVGGMDLALLASLFGTRL